MHEHHAFISWNPWNHDKVSCAGNSVSTPLSPFAPVDARVTVCVTPRTAPKTGGRNSFPHSASFERDCAATGSHNQLRAPFSQSRHTYCAAGHTIDSLPTVSERVDNPKHPHPLTSMSMPHHTSGQPLVPGVLGVSADGGSSVTGTTQDGALGDKTGAGIYKGGATAATPAHAHAHHSSFSNRWGGFAFLRRSTGDAREGDQTGLGSNEGGTQTPVRTATMTSGSEGVKGFTTGDDVFWKPMNFNCVEQHGGRSGRPGGPYAGRSPSDPQLPKLEEAGKRSHGSKLKVDVDSETLPNTRGLVCFACLLTYDLCLSYVLLPIVCVLLFLMLLD
jgi:hypothetical protein